MHPRRLVRLSALLVGTMLAPLSLVLAPGVASAQPAPPVDGYKRHMENGIKLFQDKNYGAAAIEFRAAYDAHPKASPLVNIALCYKAEFKYPKAIQALEKALRDHADSMDANDKRAAEDAIKEMRALLAYVSVKVTPNAGTLIVDGEDGGPVAGATQVPLGPGTHKIGARLDGFDSQDVEVTVASGTRDKVVTLTLVANKAWASVDAPRQMIGLDGKNVGRDRFQAFISPGTHEFEIYPESSGRAGSQSDPRSVKRAQVNLQAGQTVYLKMGPNGVLLVSPASVLVGSAPQVVQQPPTGKRVAEKPPPPEPDLPVPQRRGFYVLGGVNLVWPLTHAEDDKDTLGGFDFNSGWSGQILAGYRVNNAAGFQLLFDYANIFSPTTDAPKKPTSSTAGYTESMFHLGGGLRLMTPGKTVRLVGDLNGGLAIDTLSYSNVPNLGKDSDSKTSPQAFLVGDGGLEIDLNGVLLDGIGQIGIQTTRGTGPTNTGFTKPLGTFGLGLRVGYAFWK